MKASDTGRDSLSGMNEKETCDLTSANVPLVPPGIVGTSVERGGQCVAFDYDLAAISDESVRQVADRRVFCAPDPARRATSSVGDVAW